MKLRRVEVFFAGAALTAIMCMCHATHGAGATAGDPATPESVAQHVMVLQSGPEKERETAENWLLNTAPEALPLIEAASRQNTGSAGVAKRLAGIVERLKYLSAERLSRAKTFQEDADWNSRTALDAYNRFGHHDPKWDELARKGIALFVARGTGRAEAFDILEHITSDLKCDDPLVLYLDARLLEIRSESATDVKAKGKLLTSAIYTYEAACTFFDQTEYPADRKCFALFHAVTCIYGSTAKDNPATKAKAKAWADQAMTLWPHAVQAPGIPTRLLLEMSAGILEARVFCGGERGITADEMMPPFERAFAKSPAPWVFKGRAYTDYAWDARGRGYADTVTPAAAKLFQERLEVASDALQKAYDLDPSDPRAAVGMCHVELGQGRGRDVLEKWFQRAIKADPDSDIGATYPEKRDAYQWKMEYLQPRWYGSQQAVLAFGRECLATRNWRGGVSDMLIIAHTNLAQSADRPPEKYWHDPAVWRDVDAVVGESAKMYPQDVNIQSVYAYWAWRCGQWKVADAAFKQLGNKLNPARFGGSSRAGEARDESAQQTARLGKVSP